MKLHALLKNIEVLQTIGETDKKITVLSQDTRDSDMTNGLYFAVKGTQVDGHDFIDNAIEKGAIAIICEDVPEDIHDSVTYIKVTSVQPIVGAIASVFYGNPSEKVKIIAVTGTNGKTSVATFMSQALQNLGAATLLLSTAGDYYVGSKVDIHRKAPSSLETIELHRVLKFYADIGMKYCCLEATSIGLDQHRLAGLDIDIAMFTNLADDHLDYHGTMNKYAEAKKKLFDNLKESALAITYNDDQYGSFMVSDTTAIVKSIGRGIDSDYQIAVMKSSLSGLEIAINEYNIKVPVVGDFNAINIALVFAALLQSSYEPKKVIKSLSQIQGVPGRMQMVANDKKILAIVDYAHSSDALVNVLNTLKNIPHKNIITVIGCGGDRDRSKRAPMAQVSQQNSEMVIYTSDNPRTESLQQIFDDMKQGVDINNDNYVFLESREEAIAKAVELANKEDIILVAGKGHEDYQIIGTTKTHFDDVEILEKYLTK
ncbi:MAG: UDP-N-acetylmuramoyl-L-alanyl-D-glutamate--2,6-diaminopimelate ligase [Candidatus Pacebacteria bacterium]|nr:UDP-N-acetylmuramoyl-L-alanyl-D-glutamate--2,6-diaminopimelate ligase [Candidatus Paceibacterota bacterium]